MAVVDAAKQSAGMNFHADTPVFGKVVNFLHSLLSSVFSSPAAANDSNLIESWRRCKVARSTVPKISQVAILAMGMDEFEQGFVVWAGCLRVFSCGWTTRDPEMADDAVFASATGWGSWHLPENWVRRAKNIAWLWIRYGWMEPPTYC
jgi:hypothetical protein